MNWRILAVLYLLFIGVYGFFIKIILNHLPIKTVLTLSWPVGFLIVFIYSCKEATFVYNRWHVYALLAGIILGLGVIVQYTLYGSKEISTVLPIMSQAGLISVLLAFIFLKEGITLNKIIGIICGSLSIYFLMR